MRLSSLYSHGRCTATGSRTEYLECRGCSPWREPPTVPHRRHTCTCNWWLVGMVVGSRKTARATQASAPVRWSVLGLSMVDAKRFQLPADETVRSARLSAVPVALPPPFGYPLGVVASHRISRLVTESALLSRVPYSPGLPSPQPNRPNLLPRPARRQI